jgi:hypothetical protein
MKANDRGFMSIEDIILGVNYNLLVDIYLISVLALSIYANKKGDGKTSLILNGIGFLSLFVL